MDKHALTAVSLGCQFFLDFEGCNSESLSDVTIVRDVMLLAARESGATIVTDIFHQFSPFGVSGVVVIAESHIAIHTWPEHGYAAVDVFTCGSSIDFTKIRRVLESGLGSRRCLVRDFARGPLLRR